MKLKITFFNGILWYLLQMIYLIYLHHYFFFIFMGSVTNLQGFTNLSMGNPGVRKVVLSNKIYFLPGNHLEKKNTLAIGNNLTASVNVLALLHQVLHFFRKCKKIFNFSYKELFCELITLCNPLYFAVDRFDI